MLTSAGALPFCRARTPIPAQQAKPAPEFCEAGMPMPAGALPFCRAGTPIPAEQAKPAPEFGHKS